MDTRNSNGPFGAERDVECEGECESLLNQIYLTTHFRKNKLTDKQNIH